MSLRTFLFRKNLADLDVVFNLQKPYEPKEGYKSDDIKDRDYVLFALLVFARSLEIMNLVSRTAYVKICDYGKALDEDGLRLYEQEQKIKEILDDSKVDTKHTWHLKMKNNDLGDRWTALPPHPVYYIFIAFMYAHKNIQKYNRLKLFQGIAAISRSALEDPIRIEEAIQYPNDIVDRLFSFERYFDRVKERALSIKMPIALLLRKAESNSNFTVKEKEIVKSFLNDLIAKMTEKEKINDSYWAWELSSKFSDMD